MPKTYIFDKLTYIMIPRNIYRKVYGTVKKIAEIIGYNLVITQKYGNKDETYESILPGATYAPWLLDYTFNETYRTIKNHTLVDKYRCYELWQLVAEISKLRGALIEVGTWKGGSGALIAKKAKIANIKDTVYLCDTFKGIVKAGINDSFYKGGEHSDASEKTVKQIIDELELDNVKLLPGIFPDETSRMITAKEFRLCHIDVDVYQSAKDAVEWLWPKLVVGGLIIFDDYGWEGCDGVRKFVNEERKKQDRLVFYNLNGHAIIIKIP